MDIFRFRDKISTNCPGTMISDNVTEAWENFKEIFLSIINNMAPIKELRIKQKTEP